MWVAFNLLNASAARADKVRKMSGFSAPCQCRWKSWSTRISRASFLLLQLAERTIQAGMLQRKTPLVRMSEIARVSKLLESSQKPVTLKAISEFFDQAGRFEMNKFVPWQAALKSQTIWRVWICSGFGWESTSADKGGVREGKEFSRWQTFQFFKALLSNLLPPYSNKTLYINRLSFKRWTNDLVIVMEFIGRWRLLRIIFTFISWHFAGQVEFADKSEAITLSTVQQCCQINSELLVDQRILPILQQCEAWTVKGESTPSDGFSKMHTICSKCISL